MYHFIGARVSIKFWPHNYVPSLFFAAVNANPKFPKMRYVADFTDMQMRGRKIWLKFKALGFCAVILRSLHNIFGFSFRSYIISLKIFLPSSEFTFFSYVLIIVCAFL
jgi:hypothetical protein